MNIIKNGVKSNAYNVNYRWQLFLLLLIALITQTFVSFAADDVYGIKTVVIDAGHGGKDPGAIGYSKVQEKDVALSVALLVGKYIRENLPDVKVIYTRDDDRFIELYERAKIANSNAADLFISIHCNSTNSSQPFGTETWVLGLHRADANLEVVKRENSVINLEENAEENYINPNSPEFHIQVQLRQSAFLEQSINLASLVENQFTDRVSRSSRGVKQAGFVVLYKTTMPSVLVELGFLSNPTEEKFLASENGQVFMASAIYRAIKAYKNDIEAEANEVVEQQREFEKSLPKVEVKVEDKVEFRVQLVAAYKQLKPKSDIYDTFGDAIIEEQQGKLFRYFVYAENDYQLIREKLNEVREKGFKDAFVVSYMDGRRIRLQDALSAVQQ